jgi:hypothetical protein
MSSNLFRVALVAVMLHLAGGMEAATLMLSGSDFDARSESLITNMVYNISDPVGGDPKYSGAFYFARIYKDHDTQQAIGQLELMYDNFLKNPESYYQSPGSGIEFYAHATLHGYLLTKDRLPESLKNKIRRFMELGDYNSKGITLNLDMMRYCCGLLSAEEWPDFKDKNGRTAAQIIAYNKPRIIRTLDLFIHMGCSEMDAFIYLPTNMMYVRMLAEYAMDAVVRHKAAMAYQQMVANMAGAWNDQGIYIANPPRCKGWDQLVAGPLAANCRATALAWLFFGNKPGKMLMTGNYTSDAGNYPAFCFWVAYKGKIRPLPEILDAVADKKYPYEYHSVNNNITVDKNGDLSYNWRYYKTTYQSENYGLATQTEINDRPKNAPYSYAYKEIKRTYLAWKSDTKESFFTVCQDNPARPSDTVNANIPGYGENPYQRVMQYRGTAVGIYNVPAGYLSGKRYQVYVPFTLKGIRLRIEKDGWIFCHTGSMMFAFKTVEPYVWSPDRYRIPDCDVLVPADGNCRKGAWILETTEITPDLKASTLKEELLKFRLLINRTTRVETVGYQSPHPCLIYTASDGNKLQITFFAPDEAYDGQFKVNGTSLSLTDDHVFSSPYIRQQAGNDVLSVTKGGKDYLIDLNNVH